jgi:hypothetical protein
MRVSFDSSFETDLNGEVSFRSESFLSEASYDRESFKISLIVLLL